MAANVERSLTRLDHLAFREYNNNYASVAQGIEHWSSEPMVGGSNPSGRALFPFSLFTPEIARPSPHPTPAADRLNAE